MRSAPVKARSLLLAEAHAVPTSPKVCALRCLQVLFCQYAFFGPLPEAGESIPPCSICF